MEPMNILFIFSDEHSKNACGCYGNSLAKTPNLDKLASEGVRFNRAYCNSPVCVPARAALATGQYAFANRYWDNAHPFEGEHPSWGTRLHEQGYNVTTIGKLHHRDARKETGFHDQRIPLNLKNAIGDLYGEIRDDEITRFQFRDAIIEAGEGTSDYIAYDKEIAKQAADYLKNEGTKTEKPFALFVGFITPHYPLKVPKEFMDLYPDNDSVLRPVQFEKDEWPRHPALDNYRRYCGTEDVTEEEGLNALRAYYGLCSFMDHQLGVVLDALKESGLDKNTRIIYTSDHGETMGEHGLYFKSTMYENSVGVPFVASGPDLPKGTTSETPVSLVDIFPSIIDCVGAKTTKEDEALPGKPIWQYAKGEDDKDRVMFSEYYAFGINDASYMVRKHEYKYVHYVNAEPQLFNLEKDPNELNDLAKDPAFANVLKDMEKELRDIVDVEKMDAESKKDQKKILQKYGGREEVIKSTKPALFSPIPKLG